MLKFDISNIELTNSLFIVIRPRDNISLLRRHYRRRRAAERDSYRAMSRGLVNVFTIYWKCCPALCDRQGILWTYSNSGSPQKFNKTKTMHNGKIVDTYYWKHIRLSSWRPVQDLSVNTISIWKLSRDNYLKLDKM